MNSATVTEWHSWNENVILQRNFKWLEYSLLSSTFTYDFPLLFELTGKLAPPTLS